MTEAIDKAFSDFDSSDSGHSAIDNAFDEFTSPQSAAEVAAERTRKSIKRTEAGTLGQFAKGIPSGIADVGLSLAKPIYALDQALGNGEQKKKFEDFLAKRNQELQDTSTPGSLVGRIAGQVAATAPLVPARVVQGIKIGMDAARAGAPLLNRLGAAVNTGALSGAIFGGATSATNDKSVLENVAQGAGIGAVAGPFAEASSSGARALAGTAKTAWDTIAASRSGNLSPSAVKAVTQSFEDAGLTPSHVRAELNRLGPKATLADVDQSFLDEAEALAKSGGTPSSMMKGRFAARADTANNDTLNIFERNLGAKPDLDILKEHIVQDAQNKVKGDYALAHANPTPLDVKPIISDIDSQLVNAVGSKEGALKNIKSYFYKDAKDAQGNTIKVLKNDVPALHEIRQQLDSIIENKNPTTSYDKNSLRAIKNIRSQVDERLKTIPEMKAADEKFAERMDVLKGVDIGQNIFDRKVNYTQFEKEFSAASPEKQQIIREGIKGKIYDALELAGKGELSEATKLFGEASRNRAKIKLAFGSDADEVLNALEKEGAFRRTERTIEGGSRTGQIQAIQQKYGIRPKGPGSLLGDVATGIVGDIATGSPALLTGMATIKRTASGGLSRFTHFNTNNRISGAADIFSRTGTQRDNAMDVLDRVHSVRNRIPSGKRRSLLPTAPTAISQYTTQSNEQ